MTELTTEDLKRIAEINAAVPGWSGDAHFIFFKALLAEPAIKRILMIGVYHGRDLAFMVDILRRYWPDRKDVEIVGVDRFTDEPCADWTPAKVRLTWETEIGGPPPNFEAATLNTRDERVKVIKSDDFTFLENVAEKFDAIYLDTAHDYNTVARQLRQVRRIANPEALICGDDYSDRHTWGVKSAVTDAFGEKHSVFAGWIWHARIENLKP